MNNQDTLMRLYRLHSKPDSLHAFDETLGSDFTSLMHVVRYDERLFNKYRKRLLKLADEAKTYSYMQKLIRAYKEHSSKRWPKLEEIVSKEAYDVMAFGLADAMLDYAVSRDDKNPTPAFEEIIVGGKASRAVQLYTLCFYVNEFRDGKWPELEKEIFGMWPLDDLRAYWQYVYGNETWPAYEKHLRELIRENKEDGADDILSQKVEQLLDEYLTRDEP
jgi:hypothetical protein